MKIPQVKSWTALLGVVLLTFVTTVHAEPIASGWVMVMSAAGVAGDIASALTSSIVFFPLTWLLFGGQRLTIGNGWILAGLAGTTLVVAVVFAVAPEKAGEFPEGLLIPFGVSAFFCLILRIPARKRFDRSFAEPHWWLAYFSENPDSISVKRYHAKAQQGDAAAQLRLGNAYAKGSGVSKNEVEAVKWYRLAAEQGNAEGQFSLGVMYFNGYGVPKDLLEAYKWWLLGGAGGSNDAREAIEVVENQLTADQRAEGQKMAREANELLRKKSTVDQRVEGQK